MESDSCDQLRAQPWFVGEVTSIAQGCQGYKISDGEPAFYEYVAMNFELLDACIALLAGV